MNPFVFDSSEKVAVAKLSALKPGADVAFKAILSARFCAAIWSHISDCDETFNYWEPFHYLVYGNGLQTWEYDPEFALRSYAYLLFHGVPAWFYNILFHPNPMLIFYFVRCLLGLCCAIMEAYFYKYDLEIDERFRFVSLTQKKSNVLICVCVFLFSLQGGVS